MSNIIVALTTKQVETFFGELEYIERQPEALGVIEVGGRIACVDNEETDTI